MRIVRAEIAEIDLALRRPLRTAKGVIATRRGFLLRLTAESGLQGLGEASPAYWLGGEEIEETRASLDRLLSRAHERSTSSDLRRLSSLSPAATCALDSALLDLKARERGISLTALLGGGGARALSVCALLAEHDLESLGAEAERAACDGYRCVKLKLGDGPIAADIDRVRRVRGCAGESVAIRLDVNRAWSFPDAKDALLALAPLEVELVEEPLRSADARELAVLRRETGARIAVDESLVRIEDLSRFVQAKAADAVILKTARLEGPTATLRIAREALAAGLSVIVTDSIETSVGAAVVVHLAAALPPPRWAIGLGGRSLLAADLLGDEPQPAPTVEPAGPGLGIDPADFGKGHPWRG